MKKIMNITILNLVILICFSFNLNAQSKLTWPPPPDDAKIEYIDEIILKDLKVGSGFFSSLKRIITGSSEKDQPALPYDVLPVDSKLYLTCQGLPYLVEIDIEKNSFKKYVNKEHPFSYPIGLCNGGNGIIYITDSENKAIYKFVDGEIYEFISTGLSRPTGITTLTKLKRIYVIDTGEHNLKIYNYEGELLKVVSNDNLEEKFHFPTFITSTEDGFILINDALNYKIKRFDSEGNFISSFGAEGDSPGTFARPKGVATDSDGNIYVVDNLFDNLQILNKEGQSLLVIGTAGQKRGQFWSPSGIAISKDTVYIADTFNNRIQILHFIGGNNEN